MTHSLIKDIDLNGNSISEVLDQLDCIAGPWKVQKSLDGYHQDKWVQLEYGVRRWARLRRCWVFENELFYWCWNVQAPEPSKVLVITNMHGDWCEIAIDNQRACATRAGYNYERMFCKPPEGTSANWSKFVALEAAMIKAMESRFEQVIWLDGDILFSRPIPFGNLFPVSDVCCGWYFPTEFYEAELHADGIANGCMFSLSVNEKNIADVSEMCRNAHRDRYCQSYPFEEIALKRLCQSRKNVFRFDHITTTPHSMWRRRENYTGIHHCVSGMNKSRHQAMVDTHMEFLACDS